MRHQLEIEQDYDFDLIAICSRTSNYKLCWALNKELGYSLAKEREDVRVLLGKEKLNSRHSRYTYQNKETDAFYNLIENKGTKGHMIPEHHQADYFLMIQDRFDENLGQIVEKTRSIPFVLTAFQVDPESLKSKENLIF